MVNPGYFYTADLRSQMIWAQTLAPPSTICETLYKLLSLSVLQFPTEGGRWSQSHLARADSISELSQKVIRVMPGTE